MFNRINIVPRWIIFSLDLLCCSVSLIFSYFIRFNFESSQIDLAELSRNLLFFIGINSFVFIILKTYTGIIRYTSAQDSFRILLSIFVTNGTFALINLFLLASRESLAIPNVALIVNGLLSFLFLISYRVIVKYFFMYVKNLNLDRRRVIIYGAGATGLAAKRTLNHDLKVNMILEAFIDDDIRKTGKSIDGVKIFHSSELGRILAENDIDDLIFAAMSFPVDRKNTIVDICLNNNIKVLTLPPMESWVNGEFSTKQIQTIEIEDLLERDPIQIHNEIIGEQLRGKRILVTGAAGSIGSEIVRQVSKFGPQLVILSDQSESPLHELQLELDDIVTGKFHLFIGDVRDRIRMNLLFNTYRPHYVYHAAAYKHVPLMEHNPSEAIRTNVLGTKVLADLSVKYHVQKFVMISTDKAVNPTNIMGASKRIAEIYVQSLYHSFHKGSSIYSNGLSFLNDRNESVKTQFITTRFGNVLGSNGSVIPRFQAQIKKGGPITVTHPEITRYFMTIPEACRLVLEAGSMGEGGEIFIFDMGKSVKIVDLAKKMIKLSGLTPNKDIAIEFSGLRPGEKLYEELLNDHENTLPTHHEKIMVAKVREYDFEDINMHITSLIKLSSSYNDREVVIKMKSIVPEFKSKNSAYEEFDTPIQEVF